MSDAYRDAVLKLMEAMVEWREEFHRMLGKYPDRAPEGEEAIALDKLWHKTQQAHDAMRKRQIH